MPGTSSRSADDQSGQVADPAPHEGDRDLSVLRPALHDIGDREPNVGQDERSIRVPVGMGVHDVTNDDQGVAIRELLQVRAHQGRRVGWRHDGRGDGERHGVAQHPPCYLHTVPPRGRLRLPRKKIRFVRESRLYWDGCAPPRRRDKEEKKFQRRPARVQATPRAMGNRRTTPYSRPCTWKLSGVPFVAAMVASRTSPSSRM